MFLSRYLPFVNLAFFFLSLYVGHNSAAVITANARSESLSQSVRVPARVADLRVRHSI